MVRYVIRQTGFYAVAAEASAKLHNISGFDNTENDNYRLLGEKNLKEQLRKL